MPRRWRRHSLLTILIPSTVRQSLTEEDTEILHTNAPNVVDWLKVGDMKQFVAGSNFPIDPPQMAILQKRYKIEDYSGK